MWVETGCRELHRVLWMGFVREPDALITVRPSQDKMREGGSLLRTCGNERGS